MITTIIVVAVIYFVWHNHKKKKNQIPSESVTIQPQTTPQPSPKPTSSDKTDELINHYALLFNTSLNQWCFKKDMIYLTGIGAQYHLFNEYGNGFTCGTIEREPDNPKDKNAIRFADIEGNTIAYIPKESLKDVYESFGDEFEPRPFFGKIVYNPEGNKAIIYTITYGNVLNAEKKGIMKTVAEHINDFINTKFEYYYR